jgi:hypothetical protein
MINDFHRKNTKIVTAAGLPGLCRKDIPLRLNSLFISIFVTDKKILWIQ